VVCLCQLLGRRAAQLIISLPVLPLWRIVAKASDGDLRWLRLGRQALDTER
jgi:hypothetical protein